MKVVVTANQVPFMPGGADHLTRGLDAALQRAGHQVEVIRFPFRFAPARAITELMAFCRQLDLTEFNGHRPERVISLQFPGYAGQHPDHRAWIMHQHRAAYDLYNPNNADQEQQALAQQIQRFDAEALNRLVARFTISRNVAERMQRYNGLPAQPLYHPPPFESSYFTAESDRYVFFPSRLESLKRQELLIEAASLMTRPLNIVIAGEGGQRAHYQQRIAELGLQHRVILAGALSEKAKLTAYAHAAAVFFGPQDEDLGYVTLEAMLASKPVITCHDSGGPLEFVHHGDTGWVCEPTPQSVARVLDEVAANPSRARERGQQGRACYEQLELTWDKVVETLMAPYSATDSGGADGG